MDKSDTFSISKADAAKAIEFVAALDGLIREFMAGASPDLASRPDRLGSVAARALVMQAWQVAARGRMAVTEAPRPEKFVDLARDVAAAGVMNLVARLVLERVEDTGERLWVLAGAGNDTAEESTP